LALKAIEEARASLPEFEFQEVDIVEHAEVAVRYGVMATPAIAINGRLEFIGVPRDGTLRVRLRAAAEASARG
jgi:hypothetical protein